MMQLVHNLRRKVEDFLKNFRVKYVTKCIDASTTDFKQVDRALLHENARLMAEVHKLQNKIKQLEALIDELSSEPDVIQDSEVFLKQLREQTTFRIYFSMSKPVILASSVTKNPFKGIDGREFKYLRGIEFEKTPYGVYVNALLSTNPKPMKKKDEVWRLRLCRLEDLPYLIYDPDRFVDFLKEGWLFINMMPTGHMIPPAIQIDKDAVAQIVYGASGDVEEKDEGEVKDDRSEGRDKRDAKNRRGSSKN